MFDSNEKYESEVLALIIIENQSIVKNKHRFMLTFENILCVFFTKVVSYILMYLYYTYLDFPLAQLLILGGLRFKVPPLFDYRHNLEILP